MDLEYYLRTWCLTDPKFLKKSLTASIYRVHYFGEPAALKILSSTGRVDEARSALTLKAFAGVGAVAVFESDDRALLMKWIDGGTLQKTWTWESDPTITFFAAGLLKSLHRSAVIPESCPQLNDVFSSLLRPNSFQAEILTSLNFKPEWLKELLEFPEEEALLHGDFHHGNILGNEEDGWTCMDPKGYRGEKSFDCANWFFNPEAAMDLVATESRILQTAQIFSEELKIEKSKILKMAYSFGALSILWRIEDGLNPLPRIKVLESLSRILN